jgi:hypothetical protein
MHTSKSLQSERRIASVVVRALFGVSLMCVSSLGSVQQRALAFQEECEILEMRHDAERVRVRTPAANCAPRDRYDEIAVSGRRHAASTRRVDPLPTRSGHRLSNGLVAPLVC